MNGLTSQTSYKHRDNICYCGHDYKFHFFDTNVLINNVCTQCIGGGSASTYNKHYFMHRSQVLGFGVFDSFQAIRRRAYYTVGQLNMPFINATTGGAVGSGSTTIPINTIVSPVGARIIPGMVVMPRPTNVQNQIMYRIIGYASGNGFAPTSVIITPPLIVNIGTGNNVRIFGNVGSGQGPGLTANNQRAG